MSVAVMDEYYSSVRGTGKDSGIFGIELGLPNSRSEELG